MLKQYRRLSTEWGTTGRGGLPVTVTVRTTSSLDAALSRGIEPSERRDHAEEAAVPLNVALG